MCLQSCVFTNVFAKIFLHIPTISLIETKLTIMPVIHSSEQEIDIKRILYYSEKVSNPHYELNSWHLIPK